MSIHDMQMILMRQNGDNLTGSNSGTLMSRSLSESDLSEIGPGGAAFSGPPSPDHLLAPSDEDFVQQQIAMNMSNGN